MISCRGHHDQLQRSPKSAAEAFIALSLVWDYQKGIICRGKYALFGLVWRSPKSAAEVTIAPCGPLLLGPSSCQFPGLRLVSFSHFMYGKPSRNKIK